MLSRENLKAVVLSLAMLVVILGIWEWSVGGTLVPGQEELSEYEMLTGAGSASSSNIPAPSEVLSLAVTELSDPFYDRGSNDKGIGTQLAHSIGRVLAGYGLAVLVAIPLGFVVGMSPVMQKALNPYIQVLRPISPLAWMPLALYIIQDSVQSAIFVIFICSVWPILVNTAFGVAGVKKDLLNVARTLQLSPVKTAFSVILPAAAPTILTGMRIAIGISWLVIVAAEMLVGGTGVGYFVWNQWNNLDLTSVIFAVLMIGIVGMILDSMLAMATRAVQYAE
ncbi:nitrate ABC transporter permease [Alkalilimnicola ehrlichii MLHE-1]|uniref:Nitrate ABC transporter, inner membrane subunit n=1 Tax=Alkalilimnicola ehrlichii (strain ATCC BAA-1101 / DSM 17681 / MLHE-1) TaxID=187272 RepID=Q0A5F9_ALKEH|nr:nitrate ABC transporter permease [Alkalilimnicola ehrlichii]ABI57928.1 nitrate ABC transporter, inner membrane subunit [Alkalilimnicola ehrlichii MLHE-1]